MKVDILCTSDSKGGAAVVSHRLMQALCRQGIDAKMLVADKQRSDDKVGIAGTPEQYKWTFYTERAKIFLHNGFNRKDLFKVSTASDGVELLSHPWIKDADIVCLNWINQGFLSLREIKRLADTGKKIVWTMHDMWCCTGICHHSYGCENYTDCCGKCRFIRGGHRNDLSKKTWRAKKDLYNNTDIHFVAVSTWLADCCKRSSLLRGKSVSVIPNALPVHSFRYERKTESKKKIIAMGAARLDDPVKGFDLMIDAANLIADNYPDDAKHLELLLFGDIRESGVLANLRLPYKWLGAISPDKIGEVYQKSDIVISTSHFETLPTTLIEGLASGCIPVSFNQGGQRDIIDHMVNGYIAQYPDTGDFAEGIIWAANKVVDRESLHNDALCRFDEEQVVKKYIELFNSLK